MEGTSKQNGTSQVQEPSTSGTKRGPISVEAESKRTLTEGAEVNKVSQWIEENKKFFLPPVCNKLMYSGQLKVMFIGGPNVREDYHMEEGEEWFYQLKGDMVLKVVERGEHKDVVIKEGECFMLPSRVPHSPQRFENTVGMVIERERLDSETDGLRYYVDGSTDVLWEEWFHCHDLGIQLGPVIKKFFASEEYKTGKPPDGKVFGSPPFELDTATSLEAPINFRSCIEESEAEVIDKGSKVLFGGSHGEFQVTVWGTCHQKESYEGEVFLWQLEGESELIRGDGSTTVLQKDSCIVIPAKEKFSAVCKVSDGRRLSVKTDPLANKPKKQ